MHSAECVARDRPTESEVFVPHSPETSARPAGMPLSHSLCPSAITHPSRVLEPHHVIIFLPATLPALSDLCSPVPLGARGVCSVASGPALPAAPPTAHLPPTHARGAPQPLRTPRRRPRGRRGESQWDREDDGRGRGTYINERGERGGVSSGRLKAPCSPSPSPETDRRGLTYPRFLLLCSTRPSHLPTG